VTESHEPGAGTGGTGGTGGALAGSARGARGWRERWRRPWRDPVGWRRQLPLLVGLMLLWVLLWDDVSWGNVVNGAVVAVLLTRLFYLPPAELSGRVNLYWSAVFLWHFFVDLVRSSWQVSRLALRFGHTPRNSVIAVRLHTSSDLLLTLIANTATLIPGSSIIDVDRLNSTLYVHLIGAGDDDAIERDRRNILLIEKRLIRAIGSAEENASLDRDQAGTAAAGSWGDRGGGDR
jgi:multicomponent Na+:H+ antiporter subunit E